MGEDTGDGLSPDDRVRRRVLWSMPTGLYIVGSRAGEERNGMTLNEAMQVSSEPKAIAISVRNEAFTAELIRRGGVFSLNLLARADSAVVRKFVKPVAVDLEQNTLNGFEFHDGATGAPLLNQAYAYLDCRVIATHGVGDHTLFLGEVVDAAFQQAEDVTVLRMEDTRMKYGG